MIILRLLVTMAVVSSVSAQSGTKVRSKISVYDLTAKSVQVVHTADKLFSAPNWAPNGKYLLLNAEGALWRVPLAGDIQPERVDLGSVKGCNNDHGFSPDGKLLAISAWAESKPSSHVWVANADGTNPRQITPNGPSYYHTWSPDGRWLVYTGKRSDETGKVNWDIFRISADGGAEQRLTTHAAYDDGADFSPDGEWIYFNSQRSGTEDIWRMPATGAGPGDMRAEQVTNDEFENWFPHPSPDGKRLLFISYAKGTVGHPANLNVELRMMAMPGPILGNSHVETVQKLFGGTGTINSPSWSPDSKKFSFVSYELLNPGLTGQLAPSPKGPMNYSRRPDMENVTYGPHERNVLDFWKGRSADRPTPLLVYFHPGGFTHGDKSWIEWLDRPLREMCLARGISVATANYRLVAQAPLPAAMEDGVRVIQYLRSRADELGLDSRAVFAVGGSAGAGMSMWIGFHDDMADSRSADPVKRESSRLLAVGSIDGQSSYDPRVAAKLIDERLMQYPTLPRLFGLNQDDANTERAFHLYEVGSAITYLSQDDPSVFLYYTRDMRPLPAANLGEMIHNPRFGVLLKERMDPLGIDCIFRTPKDYPDGLGPRPFTSEMVDFFFKYIERL